MFQNLTDRLSKSLKKISGKGRLSHTNIQDALKDVRKAAFRGRCCLACSERLY